MGFQLFRDQINDDIRLIQENFGHMDENLRTKNEFAFNFWILSHLFTIDEELVLDNITEYSDKAIDCFVHYEESKELFIIQNKFYNADLTIQRSDVADFLNSPLNALKTGNYKKSPDLQSIFNKAAVDPDYKILLCFFTTSEKESEDIKIAIKNFNNEPHGLLCYVNAEFHLLSDIYTKYYGKEFEEKKVFKYNLGTKNKGTFASLRDVYGIEVAYKAYYIVTPIIEIYDLLKKAEEKKYPIFENNIREYLGENAINTGIINTLKDETERKNFIYYNNGITLICTAIGKDELNSITQLREIPLTNPQIVNGCQTVNSIKTVLDDSIGDIRQIYNQVYVMVKALIISDPLNDYEKAENIRFFEHVVKYTNSQNAISEKAFASKTNVFLTLQDQLKDRGFILFVKTSDKNKFKDLTKAEKGNFLRSAKIRATTLGLDLNNFSEICIPLDKLLQVFMGLLKNGQYAYQKKSLLLRTNGEDYQEYCSKINEYLTVDNVINLYLLYLKAEKERTKTSDKRFPIPYYIIGFFGELIGEKTSKNFSKVFDIVFSDGEVLEETYRYLRAVTTAYRNLYYQKHESDSLGDYNSMIKQPIDIKMIKSSVEVVNAMTNWVHIKKWSTYFS